MSENKDIEDLQIKTLEEAGNIGCSHAAGALSQLINNQVDLSLTKVDIFSFLVFSKKFTETKSQLISVYFEVYGDVKGLIFLIFSREAILSLVDLVMKKNDSTKMLGAIEQSVVKEACSIIAGAFLNTISNMLKSTLLASTPHLILENAQTILDDLSKKMPPDKIICITSKLSLKDKELAADFLFIPQEESVDNLSKILKS
jgi:chemotaxis protein CheC